MRYRLTLGKTDNLVLDEDWADTVGWTVGANWTHDPVTDTITHAGPTFQNADDLLTYNNVFEVGYQYAFEIEMSVAADAEGIKIFIGNFTGGDLAYLTGTAGTETINIDVGSRAFSGTTLYILGIDGVTLTNFKVYKKEWNEPSEEFFELNDATITIENSLKADPISIKTSFINKQIELFGDAYDYVKGSYDTQAASTPSEYCDIIEARLEYKKQDDSWDDIFQGNIILSDCTFDLRKKTVLCSIENYANEIVQNYLDREITFNTFNKYYISGGTLTKITTEILFTDPGGTCQYPKELFDMFLLLRQLVHEVSSMRITLDFPFFDSGGSAQYFSMANTECLVTAISGGPPYTVTPSKYEITTSFNKLVGDLNKLFCLDGYVAHDFDAPALYMDRYANLIGAATGISIDNNSGVFDFDVENIYEVINVGYDKDDELNDTDANDWHIKFFNSTNRCASGVLDLVSFFWASQYALESFLDEAVNGTTVPFDYDVKDFVYVETYDDTGTRKAGSAACGTYNINIESRDNVDNWEEKLKSDYKAIVETTIKTDDPLVRVWDFAHALNYTDMLNILTNPFDTIQMTSEYDSLNLAGLPLKVSYRLTNESDGQVLTEFKLLTA